MTTNWDKALTFITDLDAFREIQGEERLQEALTALLNAGGTFAVSQGKLSTSDFSTIVLKKLLTDWATKDEKPKHFEILTKQTGVLATETTFATYEEALNWLIVDPLISANANHPYFWGNLFEIVLCGGDGCKLDTP